LELSSRVIVLETQVAGLKEDENKRELQMQRMEDKIDRGFQSLDEKFDKFETKVCGEVNTLRDRTATIGFKQKLIFGMYGTVLTSILGAILMLFTSCPIWK